MERPALIGLIVASYLSYEANTRTSDELRIVVHPKDAATLDAAAVEEVITRAITTAHGNTSRVEPSAADLPDPD